MKVVIQQVDMDTALTAFLRGVSLGDTIVIVKGEATTEDLADISILCIEVGGSGQVDRNNFDHHNISYHLPPACRQALEASAQAKSALLSRLVDYVAAIDERTDPLLFAQSPGFPTLSDLFSGMRLYLKNPVEQLHAGIDIFASVIAEQLDPFGLMPEYPSWREWLEAKKREKENLAKAKVEAEIFISRNGRKIGFLHTNFVGVHGALYQLGCEIAIAYSEKFGEPPMVKYTIGGNGIRVDPLLSLLNNLEAGWGGPAHGTIIASPRTGSHLDDKTIKQLVKENM